LNLNLVCYGQTNPEGRTRLTRRLIMDLVCIVILETEYNTISAKREPACCPLPHRFTARSQHCRRVFVKSPERTAERISSPVIGMTRICSRLPRSISLVSVPVKPFHEIKKPRVHLCSIMAANIGLRITDFRLPDTNSTLDPSDCGRDHGSYAHPGRGLTRIFDSGPKRGPSCSFCGSWSFNSQPGELSELR